MNSARIAVGLLVMCSAIADAAAGPRIESRYTSTRERDCVCIYESGEGELDMGTWVCKGLGEYYLVVELADARTWIDVRFRDQSSNLYQPTMRHAGGTFGGLASETVEWRGVVRDGKFKPFAIIYRVNGRDEEKGKPAPSRLLVIKLDRKESVFIGFTTGKDAEKKARRIADGLRPPE